MKPFQILSVALSVLAFCATDLQAKPLSLHAIFTDHMVIQRDHAIKVWGWADPGDEVTVQFGEEKSVATASAEQGRWEASFAPREASSEPVALIAASGDERVALSNIVIGDVWVLYGQSNMAWGLAKTQGSDIARLQANLPLLRHFRIQGNEQATLQDDIRPESVMYDGWEVSTPETALGFSAIGYHFGSTLQRAQGIPIGLISAARGGASIESMVPAGKFGDHPLTKRYADHVATRRAEFDADATSMEIWQRQLARAKAKKKPESEWPKKPTNGDNLTSWHIPGKSPSDMASVYNGMFGVFKGLGIKGVLFHQGYNNAISSNCRPKRYRILTKLMVEGIREDFNNPDLPFGIIGLCAGGEAQNGDNFEAESHDGGAYIREAQRLGLKDVENQNNLMFLPAYDVRVPGLHPSKKREHGERAARWVIANIDKDLSADWRESELLSVNIEGDEVILTFKNSIIDDTRNKIPEGFSIAGEDGAFYKAHARYQEERGHPSNVPNVIRVWSPLVKKPVAIRYAWARAPMGNLKHLGHSDRPFPSFRTDTWDYPESEDPAVSAVGKAEGNAMKDDALKRLEYRLNEEAKRGEEILNKIKHLKSVEER